MIKGALIESNIITISYFITTALYTASIDSIQTQATIERNIKYNTVRHEKQTLDSVYLRMKKKAC